jgi:RNA-directed DNA polymerase
MAETPISGDMCPKLRRIFEKARQEPSTRFLSLAHLITVDMLLSSFGQLKKGAAAGVDAVTWRQYEPNARERLGELYTRLREGRYRAQPVRRVYIEKEDGSKRPLGIPALEDKIVQRAVVTVLEGIYEADFYPFSYGFRPGKSAHDALDALNAELFYGRVSYVIDADIKGYFDSVVHANLMDFLRRRIADGSLLRLVSKWLHAGVLEDGRLLVNDVGTPQGAIISPLLANVYLHYVLDEWWVKEVLPRMRGHAILVRYADDFVMGFALEEDAIRVRRVLGKRLARYGLELHESKTRLLPYNAKEAAKAERSGSAKPTFNFLGFTHYFGRSFKGNLGSRVRTMAKRLTRALKAVTNWCRAHRHRPVPEQQVTLARKLQGHYNYYGRAMNYHGLYRFYRGVKWTWFKWLRRRGGRKRFTLAHFVALLRKHPLPHPRIIPRYRLTPSRSR